jgi:hypothetical protein
MIRLPRMKTISDEIKDNLSFIETLERSQGRPLRVLHIGKTSE